MRLLSAEFLKLRTIRTSYVLLAITVLLSALVTAAIVGSGSADTGADRALGLAQGGGFFTVLATVIGVLLVTNEYRHGTVMTTFLAEPRRIRVLVAKLEASMLAGVVYGVAAVVTVAAIAFPWLSARGFALPLDGEALEAAGRIVLAFVLSAAVGAAVGAIIQSQVATIITVFVWFLVIETMISLLSGLVFTEIGEPDPIGPYLPGSALAGIIGGEGRDFMLPAGWASLLSAGYVAVLAAAGALSMTRRDP